MNVFRPAIWIAAVVHGIDADEDVGGANDFCERDGVRQEDRVAGRHVGDGDLVGICRGWSEVTVFRNWYVVGERRSAERCEIDVEDVMPLHSRAVGDSLCRFDLDRVPLSVSEAKGMDGEAFALRDRENGGRIQAAAQ